MHMPLISIIIPTLNEEKYIATCIDSILEFQYKKSLMEVFIVDGMSSDKTRDIIEKYMKKYSYIKLLDNPDIIVPKALNLAIMQAKGDYIVRLDAHSSFPPEYLSTLIDNSQKLNADNVGGVVDTKVKNEDKKSNSIKRILSHKFGVGNSDFRIGTNKVKKVDTVPFGCYRKNVFKKYGLYDERLIRNQDIELNKRIINGGGTIYLIPNVVCTYYARENFRDLAKNNYANGFWNILTAYFTKTLTSLSLRHFVPLIFILSLVLPLMASLLFPPLVWITILSSVSYLTLVIIMSFKLREKSNHFFYLFISFITLHISYGLGSFMGIFSIINRIVKGLK